jgi:maleylacetate reductase
MSVPEVLLDGPTRVLLGPDCRASLGDELKRLGVSSALVITTPGREALGRALLAGLGARAAGLFTDAAQHVPARVKEAAEALLDETRADALVALGGGSAIGVAKAVAAARRVPIVALPTTYSGSEMTDIYGITEAGKKQTARLGVVRPRAILYDPELTLSLPSSVSVASGLNALAHAVEASWVLPEHAEARRAARKAITLWADALPRVANAPQDIEARTLALRGAFHAGLALAGGIALHHQLAHLLGGSFNLPHAETHAVLLPHVTAYNAPAAPGAAQAIGEVFGGDSAGQALYDFAARLKAPRALSELGLPEADLPHAIEQTMRLDVHKNPRPLVGRHIDELFRGAFAGERPK